MDAFPLGSESFPLPFTKLCLPCHILLSIYFAGGQRWTKAIYLVTENSFNKLAGIVLYVYYTLSSSW